MDPFAFEPEQGLHVQCINNANYCYLREVDTLARTLAGSKAIGGFDSAHAVRAIHEAGWEGFQYNSARDGAELTDLFGACLYLAGLPFETDHKGVYEAVADSLEDTEHEGLQLMNKAGWDLGHMYALLNGESSFPDSAADAHILLPDNKSVIFPLKLFKIPKYRKRYDAARTAFTTEHGGQGIAVVVSYPSDPEDKRVFCCPACLLEKETPVGLATHMSKHDSLVGMTACFGTAKFQTKTRQTHVIKAAERKIELPPEAPSQPERKRPKPSTGTTASLMDVIKQQQEQQNKLIDLMKVRDQKMSDSNKVRDEHLTKALAQTDKMLNAQQTTLQAMVNITNGIGSPSLDAAEEQQMRLNAFKENAGHIS